MLSSFKKKYFQALVDSNRWLCNKNLVLFASLLIWLAANANKNHKVKLYKTHFSRIKDKNRKLAFFFGNIVVSMESDPRFMRVLSTRKIWENSIDEALELERRILKANPDSIALERIARYSKNQLKDQIFKIASRHGVDGLNKLYLQILPDDEIKVDANFFMTDKGVLSQPSNGNVAGVKVNSARKNVDIFETVNLSFFFALKEQFPNYAITYGERVIPHSDSKILNRYLANCNFRAGNFSKSLSILSADKEFNKELISRYSSMNSLRERGYTYPINSALGKNNINKSHEQVDKTIVYLLHNSLPYFSGGYATRSNGVIGGIKDIGWDIRGISRLGFPNDTNKGPASTTSQTIHGISYSLLVNDKFNVYKTPIIQYLNAYGEALVEELKNAPPAIIHGASFFMNGIAAVYAAKALGCKAVYEVRGLQELSKISRHGYWDGSEHHEMYVNMEAQAAKDADAVFTLTNALKEEFIERGVPASKITVLPNGVHSDRFKPIHKNLSLKKELKIDSQCVIGFVGSFVDYEGIDILLEAAATLNKRIPNSFHLLMVGDGAYWQEAVELAKGLSLDKNVTFTGRVPHDAVEDYYSLIDICPFPRKALPVCEMVSPLKPFEAMAMGKAVISSDVAALAEIVQDGVTGLLHQKDNAEDLANKLQMLIEQPELRNKYGTAAREWVVAERDWKVLAQRVDAVYKKLLSHDVDEKIA